MWGLHARGSKGTCIFSQCSRGHISGSTTTDREPTDREQTDRGQRRLAEKGDPKYIFTIPEPSCPNPHFVTKLLRRNQ